MSWASRRWGRRWAPAGAQRPLGTRRLPPGGARKITRLASGGQRYAEASPPKPPAADRTVRVRLMRSGEADNAGGARRDRTADLLHAMQALSQLSYGPTRSRRTLRSRLYVVKRGRTAILSTRRPDARACVRARVAPGSHRSAATPPCRSLPRVPTARSCRARCSAGSQAR
jgi:hypothetical protein